MSLSDVLSTSFYTHTHTQLFYCSSGICPGPPGWAGTRKVKPRRLKPIWIYWSKRQWVAVASAGLYASLHLIPDNHANIPPLSFFTGRMPFLPPNQQRQSTFTSYLNYLKSVIHLYIKQQSEQFWLLRQCHVSKRKVITTLTSPLYEYHYFLHLEMNTNKTPSELHLSVLSSVVLLHQRLHDVAPGAFVCSLHTNNSTTTTHAFTDIQEFVRFI